MTAEGSPQARLLRPLATGYERAIVRWHGRFCLEVRGVGAGEAQLALSALRALPGEGCEAGARALVALCQAHGLAKASDVLERWSRRR